jgi:hypothetical protein
MAAATLRWERGQLSALGEAFLRRDPNQTTFQDLGGPSEPVYQPASDFGFDLMIQLQF